jgi:hypothetical protein
MLRVEMYVTPTRLSARRAERGIRVLWPTLMQRFPRAGSAPASDTGAATIVGATPKRGANARNSAASSGAQP